MLNPDPKAFTIRIVVSLLGFSAICIGLKHLLRGDLSYLNWFNGLVFAPIPVIFGVLMILAAVFKPEYLTSGSTRRRDKQR